MHSRFLHQLQPGLRSVQRGNIRRAGHEPVLPVGVADRSNLEGEWIFVREPSRELGLKLRRDFRIDVQIRGAWSAAQPLQHAASRKVRADVINVHRYCPE